MKKNRIEDLTVEELEFLFDKFKDVLNIYWMEWETDKSEAFTPVRFKNTILDSKESAELFAEYTDWLADIIYDEKVADDDFSEDLIDEYGCDDEELTEEEQDACWEALEREAVTDYFYDYNGFDMFLDFYNIIVDKL